MAAINATSRGSYVAEKIKGATGWQVRNVETGSTSWAANKTEAIAKMNRFADAARMRASSERLAAAAVARS